MPDHDSLETKLQDATVATASFAAVLEAGGFSAWAKRFKDIQAALEASDTKTALSLFRNTRQGGMGSLSDVMVENQAHFDHAWGKCGKAMDNLRVLLEYDIDRPPAGGRDA
jgi:hypothetical protein